MIRLSLAAAACVAALAVAAPALAAQHATTLKITVPSGMAMKYSTTSLKAKAGKVTIVMKNLSVLPHDVAIKGGGVDAKGKLASKGHTSTVTATLKPGKYVFYCTVPGHAAAGMKGTLTVS